MLVDTPRGRVDIDPKILIDGLIGDIEELKPELNRIIDRSFKLGFVDPSLNEVSYQVTARLIEGFTEIKKAIKYLENEKVEINYQAWKKTWTT